MSVTFDKLGPGQSGRLVYQVLGRDGPIANPKGIRYLPPDNAPAPQVVVADGPSAAAGVAGLRLAASLEALSLSRATERTVRELYAGLNRIQVDLADARATLARLEERTQRIHIKTEEAHLREALRHAVRSAWTGDGFTLEPLCALGSDLQAITDLIDEPVPFNTSLRLASDVRAQLDDLTSFVRSLRHTILAAHNRQVGGDPTRTIAAVGPTADYFADPREALGRAWDLSFLTSVFQSFDERLREDLAKRFTFYDRSTDGPAVSALVHERVLDPAITSTLRILPSEAVGACAHLDIELGGERDDFVAQAERFLEAWLWASDLGLLHRSASELSWLAHGYSSRFPILAAGPLTKITELSIDCTFAVPTSASSFANS
jgi:hypothetical protein